MTLIEGMMESCVMMDKTSAPDGMGGFTYKWVDGAEFSATFIKASSPEITLAEMQGASEQYTVVTYSNVTLDYHDVFKRTSDNAVFRVTGFNRDAEAPEVSSIQISKVTAERWTIP